MKRRLRIALAVGRAILAGTERHVLELATALEKENVDVTVVVFSEGPLVEKLKARGVRVRVFRRRTRFDPMLVFRMAGFFRREKFDVVHGHPERIACLAAKLARVPAVLMTYHLVGRHSPGITNPGVALVLAERLRALSVDSTIAVSRTDADFITQRFGRDPGRVRFVANGIETSEVPPADATKVKRELGVDPAARMVLSAARLTPQKGLEFLLRAMKKVVEAEPESVLVIAGEGELESQLKALAAELGLGKSVVFAGYREDVMELLSVSEAFVLPSLWEGMPYALLEAMRAAKPVVTTTVCAEVVSDGETGYVVPPRDEGALAGAVTKLLSEFGMAVQMGLRGRERLKAGFSSERMAAETLQVYNEVLSLRLGQDFRR